MPKVATYNSQVEVPNTSGNALARNVEALTNTGEQYIWAAGQKVGRDIQEIGFVIGELERRKQTLDDILAGTEVNAATKEAEMYYQAKIEQDGDTRNYPKYLQEAQQIAQEKINKVKFGSDRARKIAMAESKAWADMFATQANVSMIKQKGQDAVIAAETSLMTAADDGDEKRIEVFAAEYERAVGAVHSPEVAKAYTKRIMDRVGKKSLAVAENNTLSVARQFYNAKGNVIEARKIIENSDLPEDSKVKVAGHLDYWISRDNEESNRQFRIAMGNKESAISTAIADGAIAPEDIDTEFNNMMDKVKPEQRVEVDAYRNRMHRLLENTMSRRDAAKYNSVAYNGIIKELSGAKSESEINTITTRANQMFADGTISGDDLASIRTMSNDMVSGQYFKESSYKDGVGVLESLAIPVPDLNSWMIQTGGDFDGYQKVASLSKRASEWYIGQAKAEYHDWYKLNKDRTTDEQKIAKANSLQLKYAKKDVKAIIDDYVMAMQNNEVNDNIDKPVVGVPEGDGKILDKQTAETILMQAGGDKEKARRIAIEKGYKF